MKERKTLFRRVFESMMEGRAKQAQRHINEYLRAHPVKHEWQR
jgi:outer membrane protein assembly factor BamD (BamD/ComL family)